MVGSQVMSNTANKTTILMVEDDDNDVFLFQREFIQLMDRVRVRRVRDGVAASEYMKGPGEYADREKYPLPRVILLDWKLPRINVLEFLEWLRSVFHGNDRQTPVIVLSSSGIEADVRAASNAGANAFLTKPAQWEVLLEQFRRLGIYLTGH
jgi:CheY-like chemotaxis protein